MTDQPSSSPDALLWHDGMLYGSAHIDHAERIFSVPDTGGTPTPLAEGYAQQLRVVGDQLRYAAYGQMFALPLHGGAAQLLVDMGLTGNAENFPSATAMDDEALYAVRQTGSHGTTYSNTLIRMAPGDARWTVLATLPDFPNNLPDGIGFVGNDVVVAFDEGISYSVPKTGGNLAQNSTADAGLFLGFDDEGPLWMNLTADGATIPRPREGEERTAFWPSMPKHLRPSSVLPLDGGWLVEGDEYFADHTWRSSMWTLDASKDRSTRVSCGSDGELETRAALAASPRAFFYAAGHAEGASFSWRIYRVDR